MLVSVIIPCYNVQDYITDSVDSVFNQSYKDIEVICIDNNSKDNTGKILAELQIKYPSLIIDKELKAGAPAARNKGLKLAKGEWIQFLDADDLIMPEKINHQISLYKSQPNLSLIAGLYYNRGVNSNTDIINSKLNPNKYTAAFINQCGITSSNLWKREDIEKVGGWNEDLKSSQEAELMFRLVLRQKEFIFDNIPYTVIRERESGQISQRNPNEKWYQYIDVRLKYLKELKMQLPHAYQENKVVFYNSLLISVMILAKHNKTKAIEIFNHEIRPNLTFSVSNWRSAIIKLLGLNFYLLLKK